jgi:hypothetical protein
MKKSEVYQMKANEVWLSEEQRSELTRFAKNGVHNAHLITRARTILALDRTGKKDHLRIGRICENLNLSRQAVNDIRADFFEADSTAAFLTRKKRETPPVPAKITGEVEAHIIALACSEPPKGCARWTLSLLANKAVELHYVDELSFKSVQRILKKRNFSLI